MLGWDDVMYDVIGAPIKGKGVKSLKIFELGPCTHTYYLYYYISYCHTHVSLLAIMCV